MYHLSRFILLSYHESRNINGYNMRHYDDWDQHNEVRIVAKKRKYTMIFTINSDSNVIVIGARFHGSNFCVFYSAVLCIISGKMDDFHITYL